MMFSCLDATDNNLFDMIHCNSRRSILFLHNIGSYHWQVPVSMSSSANPRESVASTLLDQASCTVTVNGVKPNEWVKVCFFIPCSLIHVHSILIPRGCTPFGQPSGQVQFFEHAQSTRFLSIRSQSVLSDLTGSLRVMDF